MFGQDDQTNSNSDQPDNDGGRVLGGVAPPVNDDVVADALGDSALNNDNLADDSLPNDELPAQPDDFFQPTTSPADENNNDDSLENIKKEAINQLSPLVKELDQSPEDKFKTLLMMIQSTDNKELIKEAYAAAEQISDKNEKAKALLAVVNEIDYFSQKNR